VKSIAFVLQAAIGDDWPAKQDMMEDIHQGRAAM
jgi:hypothetical protein